MRGFLVAAIVFGLIPFILRFPYVGVLLWAWLSYMNPHRLTWGFAHDFPLAQVCAIVTIGAWLLSAERKRFSLDPAIIFMILLALWMCLTTIFALSTEAANEKWLKVFKVLLMTFVTIALIDRQSRLNAFIGVIIISLGYYGVKGGVFSLLTGGNYLTYGPPDSAMQANNSFAMALVMTIPLLVYMINISEKRIIRLLLFFMILMFIVSIIASNSRGAYLSLFAMMLFLMIRSRRKILVVMVSACVVVVCVLFISEKWLERLETVNEYGEDSSAMSRLTMWRYSYDIARNRIWGGGFDIHGDRRYYEDFGLRICSYSERETDTYCVMRGRAAHSIYFEVLGEHGFIGLGLFISMWIAAYRSASWIRKKALERINLGWAAQLASMLQVSMVGYAVGGAFLSKAYFDLSLHLIAICVIVKAMVKEDLLDQPDKWAPRPKADKARSKVSNCPAEGCQKLSEG